jgi:DNA replication and repair protein RecF
LRGYANANLNFVRISQLKIRNFRNLSDINLKPNKILNILVGDNGQGKTSLIEGIFFLSALKSFRTGKVTDLVQHNQNGFLIDGRVETETAVSSIDLKIKIEDKARKLFVNEKPTTASNFISKLRTVVFSPESLASIKLGPEARRDLVDHGVIQISEDAAKGHLEFLRVLRQRNACLKQIRDGDLAIGSGEDILESLDPLFLNAATTVTAERLKFLDYLFSKIENLLEEITGESNTLQFSYKSSKGPWLERTNSELLHRLRDELKSLDRVQAERSAGVTLTGPHRHDVTFLFNGNDSRIYCSQGQQRAVILAFKIAEIVYHSETFGSYPLLLLDDVLSEFDETKRRFLIELLCKNEAQTFLTTTDHNHYLEGSAVFTVDAGRVSPKD